MSIHVWWLHDIVTQATPGIPFNISQGHQKRRNLIPLRLINPVPRDSLTLWRRPFGAPITDRGGLVRETFKLPPPGPAETRQVRRSRKRELTKGRPDWYRPNKAKAASSRRYIEWGEDATRAAPTVSPGVPQPAPAG